MSDWGEDTIRPSLTAGGDGGTPFSDQPPKGSRISGMLVRHGDYVDGIRLSWVTPDGTRVDGPYHGGQGGVEASFTLEPGETITAIGIRSGDLVDMLTFYTSLGRTYGPYGGAGGDDSIVPTVEDLWHQDRWGRATGEVVGIFGRSGDLLDAIGFSIHFPPVPPL